MDLFKHLIAFDLSSYGAGFALVNRFADGENVRSFELSPCGSGAQLILLGKESLPLQFIEKEAHANFGSQILDCQIVENMNPQLLPAYLAQNKVKIQSALLILEGSSVSRALCLAQKFLNAGADVIDFRVLRTFPKNVVLTVTGPANTLLSGAGDENFKQTYIENPEPSVRSFFE